MNQEEAEAAGWRILAGDFWPGSASDQKLAKVMLDYLAHTGGRAALVRRRSGGLAIYRPRAEMETAVQTERRIKRHRLRG